jgi:hypothetical protein
MPIENIPKMDGMEFARYIVLGSFLKIVREVNIKRSASGPTPILLLFAYILSEAMLKKVECAAKSNPL